MKSTLNNVCFDQDQVINQEEACDFDGHFWLICNQSEAIAGVFAHHSLQALDLVADEGLLDDYIVDETHDGRVESLGFRDELYALSDITWRYTQVNMDITNLLNLERR